MMNGVTRGQWRRAGAAVVIAAAGMGVGCDRKGSDAGGTMLPKSAHSHSHGHGHDHDHDHHHDVPEKPKTYAQLMALVRSHAARVNEQMEAGSMEAAAGTSWALGELARMGGAVALDDARVPRDKVRDANVVGKELGRIADAVHDLAEAGKAAESKKRLAEIAPLVAKLGAVLPDVWVCDMHCEPGKTYAAAGICPGCKMPFSKIEDVPYSVVVMAVSPVLEAGKPVELKINLIDPVGLNADKLETVHEHELHFLTVSNDLSWYSHEHPVRQPDGSFKQTLTFPHPGDYTFFADFTPTTAGQQSPTAILAIAGPPPAPMILVEDIEAVKEIDGYTVLLRCNGGPFYAGRDSLLRYGVGVGVEPVKDLEPYLGELGHLVIIGQDLKTFVHSHPLNEAPGTKGDGHDHGHSHGHDDHHGHDHGPVDKLLAEAAKFGNGTEWDPVFHVRFPKAGLYRAFAQFQHKGKIITAPFTIDVKAEDGSPPPLETPSEGKHEHDHDHGKAGGAS